jgi:hypothetical protein
MACFCHDRDTVATCIRLKCEFPYVEDRPWPWKLLKFPYDLLTDVLNTGLHAISIVAKTPKDYRLWPWKLWKFSEYHILFSFILHDHCTLYFTSWRFCVGEGCNFLILLFGNHYLYIRDKILWSIYHSDHYHWSTCSYLWLALNWLFPLRTLRGPVPYYQEIIMGHASPRSGPADHRFAAYC